MATSGCVGGRGIVFFGPCEFFKSRESWQSDASCPAFKRGSCATRPQGADYSITILNEQFKRKVISVDPTNGYVRELELSLTCEITVRDKDGKLVIPRQTLRFSRDYYFDELSAEFTADNRQLLENDLANNAAESIVLRLDVGSSK